MLKTRLITALILSAFVGLMLLFATPFWWQALIAITVFGMAYEWAGFAKEKSRWVKLSWGLGVLTTLLLLKYFQVIEVMFTVLAFSSVGLMIVLVAFYQRRRGALLVSNKFLLFLLAVIILNAFYYSASYMQILFPPSILLVSLLVIWSVDTGAYFVGKKFGKHKLAIFVSPGKTWEGVLGGAILSYPVALLGLVIVEPDISISIYLLAFLLSVIGVLSVFGDLFESVLKRQVNMKDSGYILPGHGGLIDRLDSLLLAMPLFLVLWQWVSVK